MAVPSPFTSPPNLSSLIDVKIIGLSFVPVAFIEPLPTTSKRASFLNLIITPDGIISVASIEIADSTI